MGKPFLLCVVTLLFICAIAFPAFSSPSSINSPIADIQTTSDTANQNLLKIGVGLKVSTLGGGIDVATSVAQRLNVRVGFNYFSYSKGTDKDGVTYDGHLDFRSLEGHIDWFPFGGVFHIVLAFWFTLASK